MKFVCSKCGHTIEADFHTQICPKCKAPMVIKKRAKNRAGRRDK